MSKSENRLLLGLVMCTARYRDQVYSGLRFGWDELKSKAGQSGVYQTGACKLRQMALFGPLSVLSHPW